MLYVCKDNELFLKRQKKSRKKLMLTGKERHFRGRSNGILQSKGYHLSVAPMILYSKVPNPIQAVLWFYPR